MSEVFSEFCDARRCDTCIYGALYGGYECEQKWLAEHDTKVRADAIKEYRSKLRKRFFEYYDEHDYPCLSDITEILDDCEMKLKEQSHE